LKYLVEIFTDRLRLISFGLIGFFLLLETFWPYLVNIKNRTQHTARNIGLMTIFILFTTPINYLSVLWFEWVDKRGFGLLNLFEIPSWLKITIGIFLLDLGDYFYHRLSHRVKLLWSYHRVHHTDHSMDVTTGYRFHPFESLGLLVTQVITSFFFGYGLETVAIYYMLYIPLVIVQHANLKFPDWMEKSLGLVLSTPNFHRVHHAYPQYLTDSNYGDFFSIWDRFFGTFKKKEPRDLQFGLEEFLNDDGKHTLWYMLLQPFKKI
jgi:sterol desaturase/sphingolipid hydroxylase (fatty acid hydroxylase superfamily)